METVKQTQAERDRLLRALAELVNTQDGERVKRFISRWPGFLADEHYVQDWENGEKRLVEWGLWARDALRGVWRRGPHAAMDMGELLLTTFPPDDLRNQMLLRAAAIEGVISADLARGRLSYKPDTDLQVACYLLLQNAAKAKVCANADCPAPYFVAAKTIQRFCSPDCLKLAQRQWSMDWYNRVGKFRRRKRAKGKRP